MKKKKIERVLEIVPGAISWGIIISLLAVFFLDPVLAAAMVIVYLIYWVCRVLYTSILLVMGYHRVVSKRQEDWLFLCKQVRTDIAFEEMLHVVLYTTYKEPLEILQESMMSLRQAQYPQEKIMVVLAGEEREKGVYEKLEILQKQYKSFFYDMLITVHPQHLKRELPCKGANATYASRRIKEYLENKGYPLDKVIISCFDADTRVDAHYFSCVTYHFLTSPQRHRLSFQPFPVYSNNIYSAPALSRIMDTGSTFWMLVESMRYDKNITFSSHSMSFKTLVDVDYWPVDMISDDSLIFWKCFLKYNGDYRTYPLEVPVYMDMAVGKNLVDTIKVQYRQKRRWAWGVENFVFVAMGFLKNRHIPLKVKVNRLLQILDNHVSWATWSIIISFITPLILISNKILCQNSLAVCNLSSINSIIFNSFNFIVLVSLIISKGFLPPRPKEVSRFIYLGFTFQWLLIPFASVVLGSFPSLDAQSRLMLGKPLQFNATTKHRRRSV